VVVGVGDQDVERDATEKLLQFGVRRPTAGLDEFSDLEVAAVLAVGPLERVTAD
jgi:hypothetical protein